MKQHKIVCIFNFPSHYRKNIYLKMEKELGCDFYFGNSDGNTIKKIDFSLFERNVTQLKTVKFWKNFNWIAESIPLVFKPYQKYILVGEPYCISTWFILLLNRFLRKQTYLWTHGWYGDEGKLKIILKKIFYKLSNGLFLYGNYAKELMMNEGFSKNKLHVVFNSLDYDKQLNIRKTLKTTNIYIDLFQNNHPTLLFIGRLTNVKKLHYIIEVIHRQKQKNNQINIVFLGDGPEKENLKELAIKLNVQNNCWFYGACYDEDKIGEFIYNADICVSPGNVGLTAMHVLMYGTPVITHNNFPNQMPEFEAVIENDTGTFFIEDSVCDLEFQITNLLASNKNRESIRQNCYKVMDTYYNPNYQIDVFKKVLI